MTGNQHEVRIPVSDGVELAATLYLPTRGRRPAAVPARGAALPQGRPDLVVLVGLRGPPRPVRVRRVPGRRPRDRLVVGRRHRRVPAEEQRDLVEVIAWLARQEWCNGNVGMFGTSYSGFNSLQLACERPPELKAIFAIFATDDRWTDDVHWRGGALRLVDLVDYNHYMTPMCVLPPVPAVWGEGWEDEWRRRLETNEPWVLTWLRENTHGDYWATGRCGSARTTVRLRTDRVPDDDRRRVGGRLPQQLVPHAPRRSREHGVPHRLLAGPWAHADPRTAMPGPADRPRRRAGRLVRPLAAAGRTRRRIRDRARRLRPRLHPARARPRHARGLLAPRSRPCRRPGRTRVAARRPAPARRRAPTPGRRPGSTAPATCRGGCRPTSASTTPAR